MPRRSQNPRSSVTISVRVGGWNPRPRVVAFRHRFCRQCPSMTFARCIKTFCSATTMKYGAWPMTGFSPIALSRPSYLLPVLPRSSSWGDSSSLQKQCRLVRGRTFSRNDDEATEIIPCQCDLSMRGRTFLHLGSAQKPMGEERHQPHRQMKFSCMVLAHNSPTRS